MGFPSVCYGIVMPKPLVDLLDILTQIRLMVRLALFYLGLFGPSDVTPSWVDYTESLDDHPSSSPQPSIASDSIKRGLPIVEFGDFIERLGILKGETEPVCAVCLSGLDWDHDIRELCNCSHAFHVGCLDKWVDQGQTTCPLCRANLLPEEDKIKSGGDSWVVERISYLFGEDLMRD